MNQEEREEQILLSLKKCDYLTREQLQLMHNLRSKRNAHRVLSNMNEYLSTFTYERKYVYYLNREGRDRVGAEKVRKKTMRVKHYLMRNDLYIHLGRPATWKNELKVTLPDKKLTFIADSMFIRNKVHHFIEVDNKQSMQKNKIKLNKYRTFAERTNFNLIWITTTKHRQKRLYDLSEGLNVKIYLEDDLR